jgi:hypothetical protein
MKTTRNLWPLGICLTFLLFFSGMATVVVIATTHRDSLVSENYYEQELKFQDQINSAARAAQSGASVNYDATAGRIVIALPAAARAQNLSGQIELYRPSAAGLDRQFKLQPDASGRQLLDAKALPAGPWEVRVAWNAGGQDYFLNEKIVVANN